MLACSAVSVEEGEKRTVVWFETSITLDRSPKPSCDLFVTDAQIAACGRQLYSRNVALQGNNNI